MTSGTTLEKTVSDSSSVYSMERPTSASRGRAQPQPPPYWETHDLQNHELEDGEDDIHPLLVSKDSHGSSIHGARGNHHPHHQILVSDPSKESPAFGSESKSPDLASDKPNKELHRRPPWPLFPSPSSTPQNRKVEARNRSRTETPRVIAHLQSSPTSGWPQRSPIKPDHEHEVASFALFTQSFETLSEAGQQYLRPSPVKTSNASVTSVHSSPNNNKSGGHHPPRKIQVGGRNDVEMGGISPIKLDEQPPHRASSRRESSRQYHYQHHEQYDYYGDHHHYPSGDHRENYADSPAACAPSQYYGHANYRAGGASTYNESGYSATASNPFYVLRSVRQAFDQFTYKFPFLDDGEICAVNVRNHVTIHRFQQDRAMGYRELEIARRRVESAVCAFGGYTKPIQLSQQSSIFRDRKSSAKEYYDNLFHRRYYVSGNHISWELENNPPVALGIEARLDGPNQRNEASHFDGNRSVDPDGSASHGDSEASCPESGFLVPMDNQQKMRYRCKLCGQLKQNHNCTYQQSLQRSIAVMVYPAVNAYTANEPGVLTKPLSEMNNFVSYEESSHDDHRDVSPDHPIMAAGRITHVTPDTSKTRLLHHSPESSLSTHSDQHQRRPHSSPAQRGRKRHHGLVDDATPSPSDRPNVLPADHFVPTTLALRPEHYRAVTPRKNESRTESDSIFGGTNEEFQYPHVPLTFQERKRLSDTVFFLSKEIPTMTAHVAPLLRMARDKGEWDLAVSQVLAQLLVGLYCGEGDLCLDGLQRYLLGIGIAC